MAETADKDLFSTLTSTNATLTGQLEAKDRIISSLRAQLGNTTGNHGQPPDNRPVSAAIKNKRYCWTHGVRVSINHNSENCRDPWPGHKSDATRDDKKGGKDAWQLGQMCSVKVNVKKNLSNYVTSTAHSKTAFLDSGCSSHYLKRGALCVNKQKSHIPIKVTLPNGVTLLSSATSDLPNANFNHWARSAHIIHGLANHYLLSCGQLCNAGYKVLFNQGDAIVIDGQVKVNGDIVMMGKRDQTTGLWTVPLNETAEMERDKKKGVANEINNVYKISKVHETIQ
jgi:hypothetical protein